MRHLHLAELRDSWTAWLSVSMTFIVVNAMFAGTAVTKTSLDRAHEQRHFEDIVVQANDMAVNINYGMVGIVSLLVIGSVTGLVIESRRGSIARLGLTGASPGQITGTLMTQLAIVSLASALIGDTFAGAVARVLLDNQAESQEVARIETVWAPWPIVEANLICAAVAMLGGLRVARRATRISPVEALRQSQGSAPAKRRWIGRTIWVVLCLALLAAVYASLGPLGEIEEKDQALMMVMQAVLMVIPLMAVALTNASPLTIGLLTNAWTKLVPGDSTWHLARSTVLGKMDRLTRTAVPVMLTLALLFGMQTMGGSMQATLDAMGTGVQLSGTGLSTFVALFGGPLAIALAGGLSAILIMARQREAELALDGVLGATPAQRIAIPALEGVIVVITSTLNALVLLAVEVVFMRRGLPSVFPGYRVVIPWQQFLWATLLLMAIVMVSTVVPTLRSLRVPEPRVIGRYVAA